MPVNYAGEGHLTRAGADSGAEGPVWQAWWASLRAELEPRCLLSFSLYCPKDNIEEALLLLLISESMVSPRAFLYPGRWDCGSQAQATRSWPPRDISEAEFLALSPSYPPPHRGEVHRVWVMCIRLHLGA